MAEVNLSINGRAYGIACDDGQESRVSDLGRYVDERLREISRAGAASSESHLLVLTALILADEIYDLRENAQAVGGAAPQQANGEISDEEEIMIVKAIDHLVNRIDSIAGRLSAAA